MQLPHYRQHALTDAAAAAGAAFGVHSDDDAADDLPAPRVDHRAIVAVAAGFCILATLAGYMLV